MLGRGQAPRQKGKRRVHSPAPRGLERARATRRLELEHAAERTPQGRRVTAECRGKTQTSFHGLWQRWPAGPLDRKNLAEWKSNLRQPSLQHDSRPFFCLPVVVWNKTVVYTGNGCAHKGDQPEFSCRGRRKRLPWTW